MKEKPLKNKNLRNKIRIYCLKHGCAKKILYLKIKNPGLWRIFVYSVDIIFTYKPDDGLRFTSKLIEFFDHKLNEGSMNEENYILYITNNIENFELNLSQDIYQQIIIEVSDYGR